MDLMDQFARDAGAEDPLGSPDVLGGRARVPGHDQLAGTYRRPKGAVSATRKYRSPAKRACCLVDLTASPLRRRLPASLTLRHSRSG